MPKEHRENPCDTGRVSDEAAARLMAEIENPHREKRLGIFPPSKNSVADGIEKAEEAREKGYVILPEEIPSEVRKILDGYTAEWAAKRPASDPEDHEIIYSYIEPLEGELGRHYQVECRYKETPKGNPGRDSRPGLLGFAAVVTVDKDGLPINQYRGGYSQLREVPRGETER